MTPKKRLHQLVDQLPDSETDKAARFLRELTDPVLRMLASAPANDEPTTDEDHAAIAAGRAQYRRGEGSYLKHPTDSKTSGLG